MTSPLSYIQNIAGSDADDAQCPAGYVGNCNFALLAMQSAAGRGDSFIDSRKPSDHGIACALHRTFRILACDDEERDEHDELSANAAAAH
jgi:hypothetical protein